MMQCLEKHLFNDAVVTGVYIVGIVMYVGWNEPKVIPEPIQRSNNPKHLFSMGIILGFPKLCNNMHYMGMHIFGFVKAINRILHYVATSHISITYFLYIHM